MKLVKQEYLITAKDRTGPAYRSAVRSAKQGQRQLTSIFGAIGIASAAAFGARFLKSQLEAADNMLKLTQRIGGSVEAFSELEFVAKLSGVRFETMTLGLQRMTRRLAEAAAGTGEAKGALKELGLSATGIIELSLDKQFETIADALSGITNQADRTRLAMKLFDSEGVSLLQTMTKGAAGIREMREEARRLGKTLSTEAAEAAVKANDEFTRLGTAMSSLARNAFLPLASFLGKSAEGWNLLLFATSPAEQRFRDIRIEIEKLQKLPSNFLKFSPGLQRKLQDLRAELLGIRIERQRIAALADTSDLQEIVITKSKRELDPKFAQRAKELERIRKQFVNEFATIEQEVAAKLKSFDLVAAMFPPGEQERLKAAIRDPLFEGIEEIQIDFEGMRRQFETEVAGMRTSATEEFDAVSQAAIQGARNAQDAFANFLFNPFDDGLKGMVEGFADAIRRILANQAATQLFGFLGGFLKDLANPLQEIDISKLPKRRALGGPLGAGDLALVGERGPELFIPNSAGKVIPNNKIGGNTVIINQNNDFTNADSSLIRAIPAMLEQTKEATKAEILLLQREGRFA